MVGEIREKSFAFKYRIVECSEETAVYGKGQSIMVLFDYRENKSISISKDFLKKILAYCEQEH